MISTEAAVSHEANERRQLGELALSERISPEPNKVVRLWTSAGERDRIVPPFVDASTDPGDVGDGGVGTFGT